MNPEALGEITNQTGGTDGSRPRHRGSRGRHGANRRGTEYPVRHRLFVATSRRRQVSQHPREGDWRGLQGAGAEWICGGNRKAPTEPAPDGYYGIKLVVGRGAAWAQGSTFSDSIATVRPAQVTNTFEEPAIGGGTRPYPRRCHSSKRARSHPRFVVAMRSPATRSAPRLDESRPVRRGQGHAMPSPAASHRIRDRSPSCGERASRGRPDAAPKMVVGRPPRVPRAAIAPQMPEPGPIGTRAVECGTARRAPAHTTPRPGRARVKDWHHGAVPRLLRDDGAASSAAWKSLAAIDQLGPEPALRVLPDAGSPCGTTTRAGMGRDRRGRAKQSLAVVAAAVAATHALRNPVRVRREDRSKYDEDRTRTLAARSTGDYSRA